MTKRDPFPEASARLSPSSLPDDPQAAEALLRAPLPSGPAALDPLRPADWRYQRVLFLLAGRGASTRGRYPVCRKTDDVYVRLLREFMLAGRRATSETARADLSSRYPLLHLALSLHLDGDPFLRSVTQASLLARQSDETIASRLGTSPAVVGLYARLFFDVRERLARTWWVLRQIYRGDVRMLADDAGTIMKLFGYFAGPLAVDFFATGFAGGPQFLASRAEIPEYLDQYVQTTLRRRIATHAGSFEVNRYNATKLLEIHARYIELDRQASEQGKPRDMLESVMDGILKANGWLVAEGIEGGFAREVVPAEVIAYEKETGRELRDEALHKHARRESPAREGMTLLPRAFDGRKPKETTGHVLRTIAPEGPLDEEGPPA